MHGTLTWFRSFPGVFLGKTQEQPRTAEQIVRFLGTRPETNAATVYHSLLKEAKGCGRSVCFTLLLHASLSSVYLTCKERLLGLDGLRRACNFDVLVCRAAQKVELASACQSVVYFRY